MKTTFDVWRVDREKAQVLSTGQLVIIGESFGKIILTMWQPKAKKPFAHYSFKTREQAENYRDEMMKRFISHKESVSNYRKERAGTSEDLSRVKVGDLFVSSWGYDQTNIDYYQIKAINGKMATIQRVSCQNSLDRNGGKSGDYIMPCPNAFIGEPLLKKIQFSGGKPYFMIESYTNAYPFDGKARFETNSMFGH